jgi:hypothetical protein
MPFSIGDRVRNVRRPDVVGVVISLDAPNNKWCTRPEDHRIIVRYPRITLKSNGQWKGGELDELPVDLLRTGEKIPEAFNTFKRSGSEGGVGDRIKAYDRRRRLK